jgi:lipopolysaccharide/colanic/teichoic acid biosynthesis glycosyltransferase
VAPFPPSGGLFGGATLINVLTGDMSLVGPRPPLPREVALYSLADRRRLAAKPGITCFWQIAGRSEIDFSGQVKLDGQPVNIP